MQKPLAAFTPHGRSSRNAFSLSLSAFLFHLNSSSLRPSTSFALLCLSIPPFSLPPPSSSSFFSLYVARVCAGVQSFLSLPARPHTLWTRGRGFIHGVPSRNCTRCSPTRSVAAARSLSITGQENAELILLAFAREIPSSFLACLYQFKFHRKEFNISPFRTWRRTGGNCLS